MASGHIVINEERCKGCTLCLEACPPGIIGLANHLNSMGYRPAALDDPESKCTGCALCAVVCPDVAIAVYRTLPQAKAQRLVLEVA
jgi:2-oxoglutarate ferredoxin oxidoreductase subunit delta